MPRRSPVIISAASLALSAALLPAILFPITYLIAAMGGNVAWCIPPLEGCTDITHTALKTPESHVFRVAMPFVCGLFVAVWIIACDWIGTHGGAIGRREIRFRRLGVIAAIGLLVGEMVLQDRSTLWILHSVGATLFFLLTYAAIVMHSRSIVELEKSHPGSLSKVSLASKRWIVRALTLMLVLAIAFRVTDWSEGGRILQWLSTYSILAYIFTFAFDWRGYRVTLLTSAGHDWTTDT
jgi:hypothetical protein